MSSAPGESSVEEEVATVQMEENHLRVLDGQAPLTVTFPLTPQQLEWIKPHLEWAAAHHDAGKPGMVLALVAQVGFPAGKIRLGAKWVNHHVAKTLQALP